MTVRTLLVLTHTYSLACFWLDSVATYIDLLSWAFCQRSLARKGRRLQASRWPGGVKVDLIADTLVGRPEPCFSKDLSVTDPEQISVGPRDPASHFSPAVLPPTGARYGSLYMTKCCRRAGQRKKGAPFSCGWGADPFLQNLGGHMVFV